MLLNQASLLGQIYASDAVDIPSSHHQAVKVLGTSLKPVAHAEDGVIEAIELPTQPFVVGVQWHPERDYAGNQLLFKAFVKQAWNRQNES